MKIKKFNESSVFKNNYTFYGEFLEKKFDLKDHVLIYENRVELDLRDKSYNLLHKEFLTKIIDYFVDFPWYFHIGCNNFICKIVVDISNMEEFVEKIELENETNKYNL